MGFNGAGFQLPRTDYGAGESRVPVPQGDGSPPMQQQRIVDTPSRSPMRSRDAYADRDERDAHREFQRQTGENARQSNLAKVCPRIPWDKFLRQLDWTAGEHFAMIGPTGQGKTTMLLNILPQHHFVTVFATKPRDASMDRLIVEDGYMKLDKWRGLDAELYPKRVLWPDASSLDAEDRQKFIFHEAFSRIYREGGWTVALDELWYVINVLKLERDVKAYLLQARALGISLVCCTQRPAFVPLEVYDQSTHLMFWRDNDRTNLDRISNLVGNHARLVRDVVSSLDRFQVLYLNTRTGQMYRTRCPAI